MLPIFRLVPLSLRLPLFYRCFSASPETRNDLYEQAPLATAPEVHLRLIPGDCAHRPIAYTGVYEWPVTKRISRLAHIGGTLIDAGANAGYFSLLWAALHLNNRVEAFEALPSNIDLLRGNVAANGLTGRITVHPFALGATNGSISFECSSQAQSGWGGIARPNSAATVQVPIQRLDDVTIEITEATTLKVDCEGADPWILEGAKSLLQNSLVKNVFFEVNQERQAGLGIRLDASQLLLSSLGFRCSQIGPSDWHAFRA